MAGRNKKSDIFFWDFTTFGSQTETNCNGKQSIYIFYKGSYKPVHNRTKP